MKREEFLPIIIGSSAMLGKSVKAVGRQAVQEARKGERRMLAEYAEKSIFVAAETLACIQMNKPKFVIEHQITRGLIYGYMAFEMK